MAKKLVQKLVESKSLSREESTSALRNFNTNFAENISESEKLSILFRARGYVEERVKHSQALDFSRILVKSVSIDIVDGCNLRCVGCPNSVDKPIVEPIPIDIIIKRIKNIDVAHIYNLRLYRFGEPLFNKQLPELLLKLKSFSFPRINGISISTNGTHKNHHILEESLKTGCITQLAISADGDATKEMFEQMRPPAKWGTLVSFVKKARSIIDEYNLKTKLTMGITLPPVKLEKKIYFTQVGVQDAWKSIFSDYIDDFDFHPLINMPGSLLSQSGQLDRQDYYSVGVDACKSLQGLNVYVDGKGIIQPCCWASNVANLGDLNNSKFSDIVSKRIEFSDALDKTRPFISMCNICQAN